MLASNLVRCDRLRVSPVLVGWVEERNPLPIHRFVSGFPNVNPLRLLHKIPVSTGKDDDIAIAIAQPNLSVIGVGIYLWDFENLCLLRLSPVQCFIKEIGLEPKHDSISIGLRFRIAKIRMFVANLLGSGDKQSSHRCRTVVVRQIGNQDVRKNGGRGYCWQVDR
jgi:hypothetical protein